MKNITIEELKAAMLAHEKITVTVNGQPFCLDLGLEIPVKYFLAVYTRSGLLEKYIGEYDTIEEAKKAKRAASRDISDKFYYRAKISTVKPNYITSLSEEDFV